MNMPYYRITIELKENRTTQGIRHFDNCNIDAVTNIARVKARQHYGEYNVIDVEAAMLSNHCTAVKKYLESQNKKRENKKFNESTNTEKVKSRKSNYNGSSTSLEDRITN